LLLGAIYTFTFIFAKAITSVALTPILEKHTKQKRNKRQFFGVSLAIYIALNLVMWIPFIG